MARIDPKYDPINRKDKPALSANKAQELEKLKADPDNKRLQEIKRNLEQILEREHERGYC